MSMPSRNEPTGAGVALRAFKNLEYIEAAGWQNTGVHLSTQRVLALLGLVVFPHEKGTTNQFTVLLNDDPAADGWTVRCDHYKEKTTTLARLLEHVRNAVAHARIIFDSDSRNPADVKAIAFEDGPRPVNGKPFKAKWVATISADDLLVFCRKLATRLEESA